MENYVTRKKFTNLHDAKPALLYGSIENGRNEKCNMCNSIQLKKCVVKCHLHFTLEKHAKPALLFGSRSKLSDQIGNSDNF